MELNATAIITRTEWHPKSPPYQVLNHIARNRGLTTRFPVSTMEDESGWLVRRIR